MSPPLPGKNNQSLLKLNKLSEFTKFTQRFWKPAPLGYRPQESKGSIIRVPVSLTREYVYGAWSAKIVQTIQESVRLQVTSPADVVVGRYQFYVETKTSVPGAEKQTDFRYQYPEEVIMLFNPWCKG